MAGKKCMFASNPLALALDALSKNQLIDALVDLARAEIGEEATDESVAFWVEHRMAVVWRYRGDRPLSLAVRVRAYQRREAEYRAAHPESLASNTNPST